MIEGRMEESQVDKELAKKVFFDVADMLETIGIQFFLSQGTCLGAYRDGGFIKDEEDIDLITKSEEFVPKFSLLEKMLADKGYHFGASRIPFSRITQIAVLIKDFRLDINSLFLIDDKRWQAGKIHHLVYPAYLFENPEQIKFLGRMFNIPTPAAEYLELRYGADYMTPRPGPFYVWDIPKKQFGDFDKSKVSEELR